MADVSDVFWPFVSMMVVDKLEYEDVFRSRVYDAFCDACDEENGLFVSRACLEPLDPECCDRVRSSHWRYDPESDGFWASTATMLFEMVIRLYDMHEYRQRERMMDDEDDALDDEPCRSSMVRACRDRMQSYVTAMDVSDMFSNVKV